MSHIFYERGIRMSVTELIAVISICLTAFGVGYTIGSDKIRKKITANSLQTLAIILS